MKFIVRKINEFFKAFLTYSRHVVSSTHSYERGGEKSEAKVGRKKPTKP